MRTNVDTERTDGRVGRRANGAHVPGPARERGIVALLTVIIIGAILLLIGVSSAYFTQTEIVLTGQQDRGQEALALASSCAEEALYRLKLDPAYTGGTVPEGASTCTVTVGGTGTSRTVNATVTVGGHTKTLQVGATLRQNLAGTAWAWRIGSWSETYP